MVHSISFELHCGVPDPKRVRTTALSFPSAAFFVLPIALFQKNYVHAPDKYRSGWLDRFGRVYEIAPDYVPTGVIVMSLNCPWALASLTFQTINRSWILSSSSAFQVRKALLRRVNVSVFFIIANLIQRPGAHNSDYRAEYVGLLHVHFDQIGKLSFHEFDSTLDRLDGEARWKRNLGVKILFSCQG